MCRAVGIPALVGFADVRNHLQTDALRTSTGTDLFVYHGYSRLYIEGRWLKATPAFNSELCDRFGVPAMEFDGRHDALLHPFTADGARHMEYVRERGVFDDLPLSAVLTVLRHTYGPLIFTCARGVSDSAADPAAAPSPTSRHRRLHRTNRAGVHHLHRPMSTRRGTDMSHGLIENYPTRSVDTVVLVPCATSCTGTAWGGADHPLKGWCSRSVEIWDCLTCDRMALFRLCTWWAEVPISRSTCHAGWEDKSKFSPRTILVRGGRGFETRSTQVDPPWCGVTSRNCPT